MKHSTQCADLIRKSEGCKLCAYPDPGTGAEPFTCGWGATGPDVTPRTVWTQAQADARLEADLAKVDAQVNAMIGNAPTTQGQFDALVDFAYNAGAHNLQTSTLLRKHLAGDHAGAQQQFARWVYAGGKILPGLVKRRASEAALYGAKHDIP
jgi:GH24 family phage-related lysozyme (muramidase)